MFELFVGNEVDGVILQALTELMVSELIPVIKYRVKFMALWKSTCVRSSDSSFPASSLASSSSSASSSLPSAGVGGQQSVTEDVNDANDSEVDSDVETVVNNSQ